MESYDEVAALVDAVALVWPHLPRVDESFEQSVLLHLRRVETARAAGGSGDPEAGELLSVFAAQPEARAALMQVFDTTIKRDGSAPGIPGVAERNRFLEIPVLYGTNRAPAKPGKSDPFTGTRGTPSFGVARVSVPDDHRMGALEKPRWWKLQFRTDPEKHVALLGTAPLDQAAFTERASTAITSAATPEALIFVHGYNVTFTDAARRAAQIAYDLQFDGIPMLYSWPSEGETLSYPADADNSLWTRPYFADFLRLTLGGIGAQRVHLLAHSMGNRVVTQGLADLTPAESKGLGQVVFAAPDVDAGVFTQLATQFLRRAHRYTLYASSSDRALQMSQTLAHYPRAGQSGPDIVVIDGLDTIDASQLDTGFMSHSYFGDRTSVLSDLFSLIRNDLEPGRRFGLTAHTSGYWTFLPTAH